jgi:hypothetical protein
MGCIPGFAKVVRGTIALLRFPEVVAVRRPLSQCVGPGE